MMKEEENGENFKKEGSECLFFVSKGKKLHRASSEYLFFIKKKKKLHKFIL